MSTVQLAPERAFARARESAAAGPLPATALVAALILLVLYAAFDHGAGGVAAAARLQVILAVVATAAAGTTWTGKLRFSAPTPAVAGVGSLALFAAWSGLSLAWSAAPDQTWTELNRALTYAVVLVLAILAGASHPRAVRLVADGLLAVVLLVTFYALGQKLVPGLHVAGVLNLNRTQLAPRLQDPFGYWNALGLFIALGVPLALARAVGAERSRRARLAALLSVELMLLTIGLTYSRGAVLALVCGLAVAIALGRARLRSLMWLAAAAVAMAPSLAFGLASHDLTTVSVGLGSRELAGVELTAVLAISSAALWVGGEQLMELERAVHVGPERARRVGNALAGAVGVAIVAGVLVISVSSRGLTGTVSDAWHTFTRTQQATNYDPARLLSADAANRWVWWREAAGAFSDRPLTGWGAGSFPVVHLLYRRNTISVQQPHSVPLQFLAETGIVGALLAACGLGLMIATGVRAVRLRGGAERLLCAALLAGLLTYAVHTLYDWDWDIPGVTLPAILLAGVLAGSAGRRQSSDPPPAVRPAGGATRALGLAATTALLCVFALSGVVVSVAAGRASSALVGASSASRGTLRHDLATAESAARLDPLSDAGLLAAATISLHLGAPERARAYLLDAVRRDPEDVRTWEELVSTEVQLGDAANVVRAVQRVAELDPMGTATEALLREVELRRAPPGRSATRRPTPVPQR